MGKKCRLLAVWANPARCPVLTINTVRWTGSRNFPAQGQGSVAPYRYRAYPVPREENNAADQANTKKITCGVVYCQNVGPSHLRWIGDSPSRISFATSMFKTAAILEDHKTINLQQRRHNRSDPARPMFWPWAGAYGSLAGSLQKYRQGELGQGGSRCG